MVTWENYEEYLVLLADGELDEAGQKELEAFMQLHPEVREELALFETIHLTPDTTQVFENKESLLRKEPKVIAFGQWFRYGAAAGLVALIALGLMKWQSDDTGSTVVAIDTAVHNSTPVAKAIDTAIPAPQKQEVIAQQEEEQKQQEEPRQEERIMPPAPQKVEVARVKEEKKMIQERIPERLDVAPVEKVAVNGNVKQAPGNVTVPNMPVQKNINEPAPEPNQNEALAWLGEDRQAGLNMLGNAISNRIEKVKEIRDNIKNTDLAVKLGNKELFTIRF